MQPRALAPYSAPALVLASLACLAAACGTTKPSRFYVLTPTSPPAAAAKDAALELRGGPSVRLGPIELPKYLAGPEIVTRAGNRIERAEYDRWASDLQDEFAQALATNLAIQLQSEHVVRFAWEHVGAPDHFLTVSVSRFDVEDSRAVLAARWALADGAGKPGAMRLSTHTRPVAGEGYAALVEALSLTIADLGREISDAVRERQERN